jgi:hypothetical protein
MPVTSAVMSVVFITTAAWAWRASTGATDVLWACTSDELHDLLVTQRGWSRPRFGAFLADFMVTALLPRDPAAGAQ